MSQDLRTFRLVCHKQHIPLVEKLLNAEGYDFSAEPFSPWCRVLVEEPRPLGSSLAAYFGFIYIQDKSSMVPPLALQYAGLGSGDCVLDMCASPGSKTGFVAQLVADTGFVLANEPTRSRLGTLRANMQALGLLHVGSCSYDGSLLPLHAGGWRYILLDPPCSGWGTEEKNPRVRSLWHGEKIRPLVTLQKKLLAHAATLLMPGGTIVYSTCTTNEEENEAQVRYAVNELGLACVPLPHFDGFCWEEPMHGAAGTLRVDGARSNAQGFYIACLRKPAGAPIPVLPTARSSQTSLDRSVLAQSCTDLSLLPPGEVALYGDTVRFIPDCATRYIPKNLQWQAAALGRWAGGRVHLAPRLRALLPLLPPPEALVLESVQDIRLLLQGQRMGEQLSGKETGLYWRDLPLGRVAIKNGRALWSGK